MASETELLLEFDQLRKRHRSASVDSSKPTYEPDDWNPELPYGGKVFLARRKKPDGWLCLALEVAVAASVIALMYFSYYYLDHVIFHITKVHAHLGHTEGQHQIGQRYLEGKGVEQDHKEAMRWFKTAADKGHAVAAYNLAIGHIQGFTKLPKGHAHRLIHHAAAKGVEEAKHMLNNVCTRKGNCD